MGFTLELRITGDTNSAQAAVDALAGKLHDLGQSNNEVGKSGKQAADPLNELVGIAGNLGLAFSVAAGVDLAGQLFELSIGAERAKFALDAMTGGKADEWMVDLSGAVDGVIDDEDAAGVAAHMLALGIAHSKEEAAEMIRVSTILGAAFGNMGAAEAGETFVTMASRMSTRQLKDFGISAVEVKDRVKELMAANSDLSEQEAFLSAVMEIGSKKANENARILDDSKSKVQKLDVATENLKESFGDEIADGVIPVVEGLTEGVSVYQAARDATASHHEELVAGSTSYADYARAVQEVTLLQDGNFKTTQLTEAEYSKLRGEQVLLEAKTYDLVEATRADRDARGANTDVVNDAVARTGDLATKLNDAIAAYDAFAGRQLSTLTNINTLVTGTTNMGSVFDFTTSQMKNYDLTQAETLQLYGQLGIATGEVSQKQIDQSAAITQLMDGYFNGRLLADEYAQAVGRIQAGEDAATVVNQTFRAQIEETATSLGLSGRAWQNYVTAQMAALKESDPTTIEGLKTKVAELNDVISNMTQPEKIMFESTAGEELDMVNDLIASTEKFGSMPPQTVETLTPSAPAATEAVNGISGSLDALLANSPYVVDIVVNQIGAVGVTGVSGGVPQNAAGTPYSPGGVTLVGEQGPELVNLPAGAQVNDAAATRALFRQAGEGGGETYNINAPISFNVTNEASLQQIMKSLVKK